MGKEKQITERSEIERVIRSAEVCRLAMVDGNEPYVIPLCFGYRDNTLYFHTGYNGRKIEILKKNNRVCFELEAGTKLVPADDPCAWGIGGSSVIGFGAAELVEDAAEKTAALNIIMQHYAGRSFEFSEELVKITLIIKVAIERLTGKKMK